MYKNNFLRIVIISLCCSGCAVLTKTQINAVNQFATVSSEFSAYPSTILEKLSEIRVKRGVYYANSLDDAKTHKTELDEIYKQQQLDKVVTKKVDISFKIIDKYAQTLKLLSSDKYASDLKDQTDKFGKDVDDLIVQYNTVSGNGSALQGMGDPISQLILLGGKQYIRVKQANEIRKFVPKADTIIGIMTDNIVAFLESSAIADLIKIEENGIADNYTSYLRQRKPSVFDEIAYLSLIDQINEVKRLRDQTAKATKELQAAHAKLLSKIKEKQTLKETIDEIQDLYESVKELKSTMMKLNNS